MSGFALGLGLKRRLRAQQLGNGLLRIGLKDDNFKMLHLNFNIRDKKISHRNFFTPLDLH